jgi:hypothetical protein
MQDGDTMLNEKGYHKLYFQEVDQPATRIFIGGLREDLLKRIYFLPADPWPLSPYQYHFSGGSSEQLLYTFDDLSVGMHVPINTGYTDITVFLIDSLLIGDTYRKSYLMDNPRLVGFDRWTEGIGSHKELLSPFLREFENMYYTLCYEDTVLYHIGVYQGFSACNYSSSISIPELISSNFSIYPNPACNTICFQSCDKFLPAEVAIYDLQGGIRKKMIRSSQNPCIDISGLTNGIYMVRIMSAKGIQLKRLLKR